ncbi:MAG: hypothetical protein LUD18_11090 [Lachnospiraceae bacterium]|nr:hypothetical protein [Lachnospiraceae bacterium]
MPEYRRFVAYFYEYIDGKKQGNAGFAKVELRNGMWRILFRLTLPDAPEPPVRVYGFVREQGYQPEFLLGIMSTDQHGPEEWAWRADVPVASGKFYFDQMTGIRIQSGDGRVFLTVWDDEPVEIDRFVAESPGGQAEAETHREFSEEQSAELRETESEAPVQAVSETPIPSGAPGETSSEVPNRLLPEKPGISGAEVSVQIPSEMSVQPEPAMPMQEMQEPGAEIETQEPVPEMPVREPFEMPETAPPEMPMPETAPPKIPTPETALPKMPARPHEENPAETLLRGRQPFRPFEDDEFFDCVQIKLCDLLPLQQEGWQVGRSNFLQHGYYLYRHLLLGRAKDGHYVVGVPGLRSQQEEYVAHTFGYDRFKLSGLRSCGRKFGYWCRVLDDSGLVQAVSDENS